MFVAFAAISFSSCGNGAATDTVDTVDTTVVEDSVDTVDTTVVAEDSVDTNANA